MFDNNLTVNKKYVESVINISFFKEAKKQGDTNLFLLLM